MLEVNRLKTFLLFLCHKWQFQSLTIFRSKHCFIRFVIMKYEKELRVTKFKVIAAVELVAQYDAF